MRYIIAATAFALVAGIALGFALSGTAFEAEAKPPPAEGRLIELGTAISLGGAAEFPLVDTSDCSEVTAVATSTPVDGLIRIGTSRLSLDGTTLVPFPPRNMLGLDDMSTAILAPWPFTQLRVHSGLANPTTPVEITAWLWCAP